MGAGPNFVVFFGIFSIVVVVSVVSIGLIGGINTSNKVDDSNARTTSVAQDVDRLESEIATVNATLCAKILMVNNTLTESINDIGGGNGSGVLKFDTESGFVHPDEMGQVHIQGENGIVVNGNLTTLEVCGIELQTAIANLVAVTMTQASMILNLTERLDTVQSQQENAKIIAEMISIELNGTVMDFNMSIIDLMNEVYNLQITVNSLEAQLANQTSISPGTLIPWAGDMSTIPMGYLWCDGSLHPVPTGPVDMFWELFMTIGYTYCPSPTAGPCSAGITFAVPDMRGRVPVGQHIAMGSVFGTMGSLQGTETHTLISTQIPGHTHDGTSASAGSNTAYAGSTSAFTSGGHTDPADATVKTHINFNMDGWYNTQQSSIANLPLIGGIFPQTNLQGTCPVDMWVGTETPPSGFPFNIPGSSINGQCGCEAVDSYEKAIGIRAPIANGVNGQDCSKVSYRSESNAHTHSIPSTTTSTTVNWQHDHTFTTDQNLGGDMPHPNVQPSLVIGGYMIKT